MAFVDRGKVCVMGGSLLNLKSESDNNDDIEMETDDEDIRSLNKNDKNSVADEAEEGELVDCNEEGLGDPVFDEHRPLSRPNFPLSEQGRPLLKLLEENAFGAAEKKFENRAGGFVTGVDIFSAEEQEKLTKRAQRFGIEPSEARSLTQKLLKNLYKCMGVTPSDPNICLDVLHMRGTEEMNAQDVFLYFKDYAPASIEWLTSSSCNVMWLDEISAARALLGLSVKIKNLKPKHNEKETKRRKSIDDNSIEDATMDEEDEESDKNADDEDGDDDNEDSDAVSISDINVDIPPGLWRKGVPHPSSKCIFLRFATRDDRKAQQPSKPSVQEFAGYVGLISESKKRRFKEQMGGFVFYDTGDEVFSRTAPEDNSNPWSAIAYSWGAFDRNKNKVRSGSPPKRPTPPPSPVFMSRYDRPMMIEPDMWVLRRRKHHKDGHSSDSDDWARKRKIPRMRMHADDEAMIVEKRLAHSRSRRHNEERRPDLRRHLSDRGAMIVIKKERSSSSKDNSDEDEDNREEENGATTRDNEEVPDLRVAVVADRSPSPIDNKEDVWRPGQVKSVLRGARAHDAHSRSHSRDRSYDNDSDRRIRSSTRKHRSRSRERHHRSRRRKDDDSKRHRSRSSAGVATDRIDYHRGHYDNYEYDSDEVHVQPNAQDLRAKISKKKRHDRVERTHDRDRHRHRDRDGRDHHRDHRGGDSSDKISSKDKNNSIFRPRSPLQIEIDNDEYYKLIESD